MNGWQVMLGPAATLLRVVAVIGVALFCLRFRATKPRSHLRVSHSDDRLIVSAYNHALLQGWPPGEGATFVHVGRAVGTSADNVRSVIARHWAD